MSYTTIRVALETRNELRRLAEIEGGSMQAVLARAIEHYRRLQFLEEVNAAYARLRSDERGSAEYDRELAAWEATLADGIEAKSRKRRSRRAR